MSQKALNGHCMARIKLHNDLKLIAEMHNTWFPDDLMNEAEANCFFRFNIFSSIYWINGQARAFAAYAWDICSETRIPSTSLLEVADWRDNDQLSERIPPIQNLLDENKKNKNCTVLATRVVDQSITAENLNEDPYFNLFRVAAPDAKRAKYVFQDEETGCNVGVIVLSSLFSRTFATRNELLAEGGPRIFFYHDKNVRQLKFH